MMLMTGGLILAYWLGFRLFAWIATKAKMGATGTVALISTNYLLTTAILYKEGFQVIQPLINHFIGWKFDMWIRFDTIAGQWDRYTQTGMTHVLWGTALAIAALLGAIGYYHNLKKYEGSDPKLFSKLLLIPTLAFTALVPIAYIDKVGALWTNQHMVVFKLEGVHMDDWSTIWDHDGGWVSATITDEAGNIISEPDDEVRLSRFVGWESKSGNHTVTIECDVCKTKVTTVRAVPMPKKFTEEVEAQYEKRAPIIRLIAL